MSNRQKETAFLKLLLFHLGEDQTGMLGEPLAAAERDERCSWRALWLSLVLGGLSVAGLCYSVVFLPDFFRNSFMQNWSLPAIKLFSIIGLGSFISSAAFYPCWLWYRQTLHRRHAECRRFLGMLLEARSEV